MAVKTLKTEARSISAPRYALDELVTRQGTVRGSGGSARGCHVWGRRRAVHGNRSQRKNPTIYESEGGLIMAGGTWESTNKPVLPGLYMNFKAAAASAIKADPAVRLSCRLKPTGGRCASSWKSAASSRFPSCIPRIARMELRLTKRSIWPCLAGRRNCWLIAWQITPRRG